jgi:hypothetical protein
MAEKWKSDPDEAMTGSSDEQIRGVAGDLEDEFESIEDLDEDDEEDEEASTF